MFRNAYQSEFLSILHSVGSKPLHLWDKRAIYVYKCILLLVLDDRGIKRRFRASNYQSSTRVKPFICTMPMRLDDGWNQIQFNLMDFTRRAYATNYVEAVRVQVGIRLCLNIWYILHYYSIFFLQIHANCRIRRVYFADRLYSEEELPADYKIHLPPQKKLQV
ncbi:unnamed protein product [Protopolystoma xenopodis]|uniref:CFA20 domain-containing protein n=1 Tax=Protopolystoma xenopodis TaxID=117903 RepID=A0A448X9Y5_9PLAT|nr:unnamed protein product [Protopolystoma xenopodis]